MTDELGRFIRLDLIGMAYHSGQPHRGSRFYFVRQESIQVDRARHGYLPARNALEAERTVVGFIAYQDDARPISVCGGFQRHCHQFAADAEVLESGPHCQGPEQQGFA